MNIYTKIAYGVAFGAISGTAAYVMSHGHTPEPLPHEEPVSFVAPVSDESLAYWNQVAADAAAARAARLECSKQMHHTIYNGVCVPMVNCTGCTSKKGHGLAVPHDYDNRAYRYQHPAVDYLFQVAEFTRHAKDAEADIAARRAGEAAYHHVMRCTRVASDADVQCNRG